MEVCLTAENDNARKQYQSQVTGRSRIETEWTLDSIVPHLYT